MISSVYMSGRLGDKINDEFRYIEVDRMFDDRGDRKLVTDKFPVRSMVKGRFYDYPNGAMIILKGRIEMDEKLGLVIVDELDEIFPLRG